MADLLTAIQTLATKLIPNSTGDKKTLYTLRLAEYATRLAGQSIPKAEVTAEPEAEADEPLSSDPSVAIHQLLARYGHPTQLNEAGESIATDPNSVLAATPDNGRELALLGYFGVGPSRHPNADHSLRDKYYTANGAKPIDPDVNAWGDYLKGASS